MASVKLFRTLDSTSNVEEEIKLVNENLKTCSEEQLRKREWSEKLYLYFCKKGRIEPFPIDGKKAACFIHFLGVSEYALSSIQNFIIPSLKELSIEKTGMTLSVLDLKFIAQAYRSLRNNPEYTEENRSIQPCILEDINYMISNIPDGYSKKSQYASLFLFSLSCGARAISCESIKLGSIKKVEIKYEKNLVQLDISIPSTKGNKFKWNHSVRLEGHGSEESSTNFFYWLNKFLKERHALDLLSFDGWDLNSEEKEKSLWNMNTDAMRTAIKSISEKCGYPSNLFCFHSLRSGFMSSIVLKSLGNEKILKSSIESSALVGGWKAGSDPHLKYFKSALTKEIICSRLIDPNLSNELVNSNRTIESFHNIKLSAPSWNVTTNYEHFYNQINSYIEEKLSLFSNESNNIGSHFIWIKHWEQIISQTEILDAEFKMIQQDLQTNGKRKLFGNTHNICVQKLGREYIVNKLLINFNLLNELVKNSKELVDTVLIDYESRVRKQPERIQDLELFQVGIDRSKTKNYWKDNEIQLMIRLYCKKLGNEEIARQLRPRTGTDIKDKIKNLLKKFGSFEQVILQYCPNENLSEPLYRRTTKPIAKQYE